MSRNSSDDVLDAVLADERVDACLDGKAVVAAMLAFEVSLAQACAAEGLIPVAAADAIARAAEREPVDAVGLAERTMRAGTPVVPLIEDLSAAVDGEWGRWVHFGATTQDVVDTALALMARQVSVLVVHGLRDAATSCAGVARAESGTVIAARTLGQHAQPTTFGLKAAGWCVSLWRAHDAVAAAEADLAVQLGGAVGTLAAFQGRGLSVASAIAADLGLAVPTMPFHTERSRILRLAAALGEVCAAWSKIAVDVLTLAQSEIGELSEATPGGGRSSAMPHKRNPAVAISIRAGCLRAPALVATMFGAAAQENERGVGGWQAEWWTLRELLRLTGAIVSRGVELLSVLDIDRDRMRANLNLTHGLLLSERLSNALAGAVGRVQAHAIVRDLAEAVSQTGQSLRDVAAADSRVRDVLPVEQLDEVLDPANALGEVDALISRALEFDAKHARSRPDS